MACLVLYVSISFAKLLVRNVMCSHLEETVDAPTGRSNIPQSGRFEFLASVWISDETLRTSALSASAVRDLIATSGVLIRANHDAHDSRAENLDCCFEPPAWRS